MCNSVFTPHRFKVASNGLYTLAEVEVFHQRQLERPDIKFDWGWGMRGISPKSHLRPDIKFDWGSVVRGISPKSTLEVRYQIWLGSTTGDILPKSHLRPDIKFDWGSAVRGISSKSTLEVRYQIWLGVSYARYFTKIISKIWYQIWLGVSYARYFTKNQLESPDIKFEWG